MNLTRHYIPFPMIYSLLGSACPSKIIGGGGEGGGGGGAHHLNLLFCTSVYFDTHLATFYQIAGFLNISRYLLRPPVKTFDSFVDEFQTT